MTYNGNNSHLSIAIALFVICGSIIPVISQECIRATAHNAYVTRERTFLMIKPDGVQRGLVGEIIKRLEQKGLKLVALNFKWVSNL